jgi:putative PEP-CTERM system histidine kinase
MTSDNLVLTAWSGGLAGFGYLVFAIHLIQRAYLRPPFAWAKLAIFSAVSLTALWGWLELTVSLTHITGLSALGNLADQLRYASWYVFLLMVLHAHRSREDTRQWMVMVLLAVALTAWGLVGLGWDVLGMNAWGKPSRWMLFSALAMPLFAMVLLEQVFRNATDDSRWNLKPLCSGLAAVYVFDLYLFSQAVLLNHIDRDALSLRGSVHALMMPLLLLSCTRRRDWIARIQLSPKAVFHSATLLLAGMYLMFISGVGYYVRYFGGEWGRSLQLCLVVLALIVLVLLALSGTLRAKLRVFLGKHFFRYRYDYREEWLKFTQALSATNSPSELGQQVILSLAGLLESPAGGLWMQVKGEAAFGQVARWNMAHVSDKEDASSAMCQYMAQGGNVINLEEHRSLFRRYGPLTLPAWLQALPHAWLLVPLMVGDDLTGFVVLTSARTRFDVNWEVHELLKTTGQQAASYLAQMQATEALLEVRKFDAFNKMSAFVVHDLKNIMTQLSLMLKNAQRLGSNHEFQKDMLMTVENSLDRMRLLMLQLREGATPPGAAFGVNLEAILHRVQAMATTHGCLLDIQVLDAVDARGHEERLERIVGHLVQNALDATDPGGRVTLRLDRMGSQARVVVMDTGCGMSEDFMRDRLFKPFQTTKPFGMGIGIYESFQYVQELGGKLDVQSEVGQGTTVTLLLPLFDAQKASDLHPLECA